MFTNAIGFVTKPKVTLYSADLSIFLESK